MEIAPFKLERYFARHEFSARWLLSSSDCETMSMQSLLELADGESRALWDGLRLGYTESMGHPLLRAEIASLYERITPEQVVTAVPEEAILVAMHSVLKPGDRVVAVTPAYQSLHEVARAMGCQVEAWPVELRDDRWNLDLARLERLLQQPARLVVLNFPHNPTGFLPSRETFTTAVELATRQGALVFSDEMYRLLEHDPSTRLPAACDLSDRAISLSGLSKAFGLAGLRLGWLATRDADLMQRFRQFKDYTTICGSAPSEILGIIALRARDGILRQAGDLVRSNLQTATEYFGQHADLFRWIPPNAGSTAYPRWLGPGTVDTFCEQAVEKGQVMVVPQSLFDQAGPHFRVGLGRQDFPRALDALDTFLRQSRYAPVAGLR